MPADLYEIHQVEREDLNEGWIWLRNEELRAKVENRRPILLVEDEVSRARVWCEVLYADSTYLDNRRNRIPPSNQNNLLFLSAWYRHQLRIENEVGSSRKFDIKFTSCTLRAIWWQARACVRHPQIAVVMSAVLAVVGLGLAIVGLAFVLKDAHCAEYLWLPVAIVGVVITLLGARPLVLRVKN